jgi:hypothetical protein
MCREFIPTMGWNVFLQNCVETLISNKAVFEGRADKVVINDEWGNKGKSLIS